MKNILTLIGLMILSGCSTSPITHGIPNLALVEPWVWRGGQPNAEGFAYLKSLGVHNVIKLNEESEGQDDYASFDTYDVPVSLPQQLGLEPMPNNFGLGYKSNVGGTFIHCQHGQDRTGLFVAMWRVRFDAWPKADAEKEMLAHGFHKSLIGLWKYWEDFNK